MGPRSDERGNGHRGAEQAIRSEASMGPRSDERGNSFTGHYSDTMAVLQWGRARMSAEIQLVRPAAVENNKLQWGRARMSAEMRSKGGGSMRETELQWGRARMSAEIPRP